MGQKLSFGGLQALIGSQKYFVLFSFIYEECMPLLSHDETRAQSDLQRTKEKYNATTINKTFQNS